MTSVDSPQSARFGFGRNWQRFLSVLNDERLAAADDSLRELLGVQNLEGRTFLDIGSGSGLFSLAAMRLGAARVHSFDYDEDSVACTRELKRRYFPTDTRWTVEQGSVLDDQYVQSLGRWDVVYSWGVLHHTGNMQQAFTNALKAVPERGDLAIAIYNDQGWKSRAWWRIKQAYNSNSAARMAILGVLVPAGAVGAFAYDLVRLRNPFTRYTSHTRGMSHVHDMVDWLGGFPFEVASRDEIRRRFESSGMKLEKVIDCGDKMGCNQFLFRKGASTS